MEARDCAVLFELDARAVSFDDVRAGSDKQVFYSGSLDGSRDRIFENRHESLFLLTIYAGIFCKRYFSYKYDPCV